MQSNILHNLFKYHPTIKGHHGYNRLCRHDATKGRHDSLRHADFSGCCDASTALQLMQVSPTSGNRETSTLARPRLAGRAGADKAHTIIWSNEGRPCNAQGASAPARIRSVGHKGWVESFPMAVRGKMAEKRTWDGGGLPVALQAGTMRTWFATNFLLSPFHNFWSLNLNYSHVKNYGREGVHYSISRYSKYRKTPYLQTGIRWPKTCF
jgi:hypothetical protein